MMAYTSPAHQLDALGNLEAHLGALKSTFVFKDDQGNVINKKAPNTLEFNDNAEDFTFVGQSSYDSQMQKLGLAEKKGADDKGKSGATGSAVKLSPEEKILHGITALETTTDFLLGKTTPKGTAPKLETLSVEQYDLLQSAQNLVDAARKSLGLKADIAFREGNIARSKSSLNTISSLDLARYFRVSGYFFILFLFA